MMEPKKSMREVLEELKVYNETHSHALTYGKYIQMLEQEETAKKKQKTPSGTRNPSTNLTVGPTPCHFVTFPYQGIPFRAREAMRATSLKEGGKANEAELEEKQNAEQGKPERRKKKSAGQALKS